VLGEWALSTVGVEEGREFRFRGDLYSQESTFPVVLKVLLVNLLAGLTSIARGHPFLPYSGPYGCRIADRRLEMFPMRITDATNLNLWTGSISRKVEVLSKMPEC